MATSEPRDEDEPRPKEQLDHDARPSERDGADPEAAAPERPVARARDREWGFLARALHPALGRHGATAGAMIAA